jgi:hypothetical protein
MDEIDDNGPQPGLAHTPVDMGERFRTWRRFVSLVQWHVVAAAILLLLLLLFRAHG